MKKKKKEEEEEDDEEEEEKEVEEEEEEEEELIGDPITKSIDRGSTQQSGLKIKIMSMIY